jgi:AbrB family looped-hinge helix DNA binding protein
MEDCTCKVDNQGRVMLPADWRKRFQVGPATQLIVREDVNGALVVETREQGLRRAQELVARYIPPDSPSLVDELLKERRQEAACE